MEHELRNDTTEIAAPLVAHLLLLTWVLRSAPARLLHALWWVGVAKLFLPLPLLEQWTAPLLTLLPV